MITFDTGQLADFAADLGRANARSQRTFVKVFEDAGDELVEKWAAFARETSGVHGKHYPASIDKERHISTNISIEVGPNPSKPQGGMSFDAGSVHQPPHLDSVRAGDAVFPSLPGRIAAAMSELGL